MTIPTEIRKFNCRSLTPCVGAINDLSEAVIERKKRMNHRNKAWRKAHTEKERRVRKRQKQR